MNLSNLKIQTGDLYLGSGQAKTSYLTKWLTNSNFSHSGLLWENQDKILTLEAYKPNLKEPPDYLTGKFGKGVQVVNFQDRINTYNGGIILLRLKDKYNYLRPKIKDSIIKNKYYRVPFCSNYFKLAAAALKLGVVFNSGSALFCSELVLTLYREAGIVEASVKPWQYTPVDLLRHFGYLFEPAIVLKPSGD